MLRSLFACAAIACAASATRADTSYDVVVYGGTSGGVIAAVQAGRMGKSVVLIEPGKHLGGMTSGGLGATDMGNQAAIGGVSREFYRRIKDYYQDKSHWKSESLEQYAKRERYLFPDAQFSFEPHVAEQIFNEMAAEAKVKVVYSQRLDLKAGVTKQGQRITAIAMESGERFAGKEFVDATYEGDLLAKAQVSYAVGREPNAQYGETIDGIEVRESKSHQFTVPVDPYVKPGDPASGLLPNIHAGGPGVDGEGDKRQQAYNYRLCLTNEPENRIPFTKPPGYDARDYELLVRYYEAGFKGMLWNPRGMPNKKTDTNNNGAFSTDFIGMNNDYPDADYATRDKIIAAHIRYTQGFLWTLANDPRIPEKIRENVGKWGLSKDEFVDNNNWPYQLYVREARRMVSDYVMTQSDIVGKRQAPDPVGLGSYTMDSHNCQRYVDETGHARNEGDVQVHGFSPYGISYKSLVPKSTECTNLLVPICMSATHIAYGSIRMEPVYMILGQACGTAAVQAINEQADVQKVDYAKLRERLLADKQLIEWKGGKDSAGHAAGKFVHAAELGGIVVNDADAKLTGEWQEGSAKAGVEGDYRHDANEQKGSKTARFEAKLPADGNYEVRFAYVANANRATNVPVTIESADGSKTVTVNEKARPPIDGIFTSLGTYRFSAAKGAAIIVSNKETNGFVVIDAVQLLPAK